MLFPTKYFQFFFWIHGQVVFLSKVQSGHVTYFGHQIRTGIASVTSEWKLAEPGKESLCPRAQQRWEKRGYTASRWLEFLSEDIIPQITSADP